MEIVETELYEVFKYKDNNYITIKSDTGGIIACENCDLFNLCTGYAGAGDDIVFNCTGLKRKDKNDVYFKKL